MKTVSVLSLALIGGLSTASIAGAQDFKTLLATQGINPPPKTVPYRYYMDINATGTERDGSGETQLPPMSARLLIDPSQPDGSRVRVIEQTTGDGETAESLREMVAEIENDVLSVKSTPGKGSIFSVLFPRAQMIAPTTKPQQNNGHPTLVPEMKRHAA